MDWKSELELNIFLSGKWYLTVRLLPWITQLWDSGQFSWFWNLLLFFTDPEKFIQFYLKASKYLYLISFFLQIFKFLKFKEENSENIRKKLKWRTWTRVHPSPKHFFYKYLFLSCCFTLFQNLCVYRYSTFQESMYRYAFILIRVL